MVTEREFIRNLQLQFPAAPPVLTGIGDDGAVLDTTTTDRQVIVTDMLLDGTHFDLSEISPAQAGRKAIAVNLSDLAAMACRPVAGFVSLAIPRSQPAPDEFLASLCHGIEQVGLEYSCPVAGGDTNAWNGPFAVNVCLVGTPFRTEPVLRSGAQPGDVLYVTGPLGGSLPSGRHLTFAPRLPAAQELSAVAGIHSMMDISDGLTLDLSRMMEASQCGAEILRKSIPVHDDVDQVLPASDRLLKAMTDGEDFELLIAASPAAGSLSEISFGGCNLVEIGRVTDKPGVVDLIDDDGKARTMPGGGWQHL